MSFLSRMTCGTFGIVRVTVDALRSGPLRREDLIAACCPRSAVPDQTLFEATLDTWTTIGLFGLDVATNRVSLAEVVTDHDPPLPTILRRLLLRPPIEPDLWVDDSLTDFLRATAWLMGQEPYQFLGLTWSGINKLLAKQFPVSTPLLSSETWPTYRHWARVLGFGWETWYPGNVNFMIDPSEAIRSELATVFGQDTELTITAFLTRLAKAIPVLDHGSVRAMVEDQRIDREDFASSETISPTLSFALERLNHTDVLRLRNDGEGTHTMLGRGFTPWKPVSHVVWGGAHAAG